MNFKKEQRTNNNQENISRNKMDLFIIIWIDDFGKVISLFGRKKLLKLIMIKIKVKLFLIM